MQKGGHAPNINNKNARWYLRGFTRIKTRRKYHLAFYAPCFLQDVLLGFNSLPFQGNLLILPQIYYTENEA
jgi:hypothetical protein